MRKFNPDKELYKIKYGKRDKILVGIIILLVIISISSTFALYQVRRSKRIIYTTVDDFSNNKDIILSVYLDDKEDNKFPEKNTGYIYLKTVCNNNSEAYFDTNKWILYIGASTQDKCTVYFVSNESTPNVPELYQGMVPVVFDESGNMKVADTTSDWYDYENHKWANAVLVNASDTTINNKYFYEGKLRENLAGTEVPMSEVLQMYVWIPRYKYQLFNAKNEEKEEQMINVIFENGTETTGTVTCSIASNGKETCENDENGEWYTHPAFKFGNTELTGMWVGKFETSGSISDLKVLPNNVGLSKNTINSMFNAARNIEGTNNKYNLDSSKVDTHMMKNMEWGAVAYLNQSKYGRCNISGECEEVTKNANTSYYTGYANTTDKWNTLNGVKASTTGNMYGIYDMNGCGYEYMMANAVSTSGSYNSNSTGPTTKPADKYIDTYEAIADPYAYLNYTAHGHLGDATREILKTFNNTNGGWYNCGTRMVVSNFPWVVRGNLGTHTISLPGIFAFDMGGGNSDNNTMRVVITAEDK